MKKIFTTLLSLAACSAFAQTTVLNFDDVNPAFDFPFDGNITITDLGAGGDTNPDTTGNTTTGVRLLSVGAAAGDFTGYGGEFTAPFNFLNMTSISLYLRSDQNNFTSRFQFTDDPTGNRTQNPIEADFTYTGAGDWQLVTAELAYAGLDFGIPGGPLDLNNPIATPPAESGLPTPYTPNLDGIVNRYSVFPDFNDDIAVAFSFWFDEIIVDAGSAALSTGDFAANEVSVFPVPATLAVNIQGDISGDSVNIFDIAGNLVGSRAITGDFNSVDVSALATGVYFLQLENESVVRNVKA